VFFSDAAYRNTCWLKKDITDKVAKNEAISGPKECGSSNPCCDLVYFGSTGSLAGSIQNHVIGNYEKINEGPEGHWNYKQQGGKLFLYYLPYYKVGILGSGQFFRGELFQGVLCWVSFSGQAFRNELFWASFFWVSFLE
jgi:hypothetical protein